MAAKRVPSAAALAQAQELTPILAEMIESNDPSLDGLKFDQIEASAAAIGDVLARALMLRAARKRGCLTPKREMHARQIALQGAGAAAAGLNPEELRMVRGKARKKKIKTVRGMIEVQRNYLYFPELHSGVFPPRPAT